jgi:hypothetical protein
MSLPLGMMALSTECNGAVPGSGGTACLPDARRRDWIMRDWGDVLGTQHLVLAETLGLAMARRAAEILDRHRAALAVGRGLAAARTDSAPVADDEQFAADNAIFTAVLDAANECLGRFDGRPADERWCDALLQLIQLAQFASDEDGVSGIAG